MKKLITLLFLGVGLQAQELNFEVDLRSYQYDLTLTTSAPTEPYLDLEIPAWSPGYYQVMDFGKNFHDFHAYNEYGDTLRWIKFGHNTWRIYTSNTKELKVKYKVRAERNFVGTAFIDKERAFLKPSALFLHRKGEKDTPAQIHIQAPSEWTKVATGLDSLKAYTYYAKDVDILYDSPLLIGELKELPPFEISGKKHRFLGYAMGTFDGLRLMNDLKKIITTAIELIRDIPYEHYTFIGLGPGNGGIEQLNSTAVAFTGQELEGPGRTRTLSFLTHEYFHHFNAKRIRPIELGPFDYSQPNRTNMLWVAEGLTAYYENIIMNRAGLLSAEEMKKAWSASIANFQKNPGRLKQTLAESSAKTWEDGPFGKKGETISYYEKGPLVGMLLDIRIRTATQNTRSLDDVMRYLYHEIYKKENRGYTDAEFIKICEKYAGTPLDDIFQYVYSTEELDYAHYFRMLGIDLDENYQMTLRKDQTALQKKIYQDLFR